MKASKKETKLIIADLETAEKFYLALKQNDDIFKKVHEFTEAEMVPFEQYRDGNTLVKTFTDESGNTLLASHYKKATVSDKEFDNQPFYIEALWLEQKQAMDIMTGGKKKNTSRYEVQKPQEYKNVISWQQRHKFVA